MQPGTGSTDSVAETHERVAVNARQPVDGPERHALGEQSDGVDLLRERELIHVVHLFDKAAPHAMRKVCNPRRKVDAANWPYVGRPSGTGLFALSTCFH